MDNGKLIVGSLPLSLSYAPINYIITHETIIISFYDVRA